MSEITTLGFIGLGVMGEPMCRNLAQKSALPVFASDLRRETPERLAEAFALRVVDDRKPDEVCKVLSITPTNLWVALHRARARLRACLEENWFQPEAAEGR